MISNTRSEELEYSVRFDCRGLQFLHMVTISTIHVIKFEIHIAI